VLCPQGALAIVWNERDQNDETQRALTEIIEPYRRDEPRQADEAWRQAFDDGCGFGMLEARTFRHLHSFSAQSLVERVASISFIAALPEWQRTPLLEQVRKVGALRGDSFRLPHTTHLYLTRSTD
jgi:hypothetical protein